MANAATPELAAAVSEAGGLGFLGTAMLPPDQVLEQAEAVRSATSRPFGLNFFCHGSPDFGPDQVDRARAAVASWYAELGLGDPPDPTVPPISFDGARLEAALAVRPAVVSFHFGVPDDSAIRALHDAGARVLASATTVTEARWVEEAGVDAVVAQGAEAGGHRGSFLVSGDDGPVGTLALVPQVVDAVDVPVIAAGGIADGRGLAAALALGAAGVQMGTAFLTCPETKLHPLHRETLLAAQAEGTAITRAISGRPARALRNRLIDELAGSSDALPYPAQLSLVMALSQTAAERGSADFLPMFTGQAAGLAQELPAAELVRTIVRDAERVLAALAD